MKNVWVSLFIGALIVLAPTFSFLEPSMVEAATLKSPARMLRSKPVTAKAVKCPKSKRYDKKKKKCVANSIAQGQKIFNSSCALSGCHVANDPRFIKLSPEALDDARASIPEMQYLTISQLSLNKLFAFFNSL